MKVLRRALTALLGAVLICLAPARNQAAAQTPLRILIFERPPYYTVLPGGKPDGFLVQLTVTLLQEAGIPHEFSEMPARRILERIRQNSGPECSIGWFKTPEREEFSRFSLPIYRDMPLMAVFRRGEGPPPGARATLEELARHPGLTLGLNETFSFGHAVDAILAGYAAPPMRISASQDQLLRMLLAKRFDYMLINPEEFHTLATQAGIDVDALSPVKLDDLPRGNRRYLMCARCVDDATMDRINKAISRLVCTD